MSLGFAHDSLEVCRVVFRVHLNLYFLTMRLRSCPSGVKANTPKVDGLMCDGEERMRRAGGASRGRAGG